MSKVYRTLLLLLTGLLATQGLVGCEKCGKVTESKAVDSMEITCKGPDLPQDVRYYVSGLIGYAMSSGNGGYKPGPKDSIIATIVERVDKDDAFKSSEPTEIYVGDLNPMLAEAFQLMTTGQKQRVWIPIETKAAATDGFRPTHIVYDLELKSVTHEGPRTIVPDELRSPSK